MATGGVGIVTDGLERLLAEEPPEEDEPTGADEPAEPPGDTRPESDDAVEGVSLEGLPGRSGADRDDPIESMVETVDRMLERMGRLEE